MRMLLLLVLMVSGCAGEPACRLEQLAELPVRVAGKVPLVTVEINGRPATMVLDTGSDATVLSRAAAARLGVVASGEERTLGGAGGRARVGVAPVGRLVLGGVAVPGARVLLTEGPAAPLDGVLGIDVLIGFELELDAPAGRAVLYRARRCAGVRPGWAGASVQLAAQQQPGSGHLFVPVTLDGQTLRGCWIAGRRFRPCRWWRRGMRG